MCPSPAGPGRGSTNSARRRGFTRQTHAPPSNRPASGPLSLQGRKRCAAPCGSRSLAVPFENRPDIPGVRYGSPTGRPTALRLLP